MTSKRIEVEHGGFEIPVDYGRPERPVIKTIWRCRLCGRTFETDATTRISDIQSVTQIPCEMHFCSDRSRVVGLADYIGERFE